MDMRKINFQHGLLTVIAVALLAFTMSSCDNMSKKRACKHWSKAITHQFPNTNWAFEEEVLEFPFDIEDTSRFYDISVILQYDTSVATLRDIPLSLTLSAPDGMKSFCTSHFLLDKANNPDIKMLEANTAELEVVVYPHRKLKAPGTHTLTVYRRAEKADNYGFLNLTTKVKVAK